MDLKCPFYLQLYEPTRFEKEGGFSRKSPTEVAEGILCFEQEPTIMFYNAICWNQRTSVAMAVWSGCQLWKHWYI